MAAVSFTLFAALIFRRRRSRFVMVVGSVPVAEGWVASLARLGGNITRVTTVAETAWATRK